MMRPSMNGPQIQSSSERRGWRTWAPAALLPALLLAGCGHLGPGPNPAKVTLKFVIYDNDNSFAATVYAQEVQTGLTTAFAYGPHTPLPHGGPEGPGDLRVLCETRGGAG